MSVIDSLAAAKVKFSARNLIIANHICELTDKEEVFAYDSTTKAGRLHEFRELANAEWVLAEPEVVHFGEAQFRSKIARQPQIQDDIIEAMRANPSKSALLKMYSSIQAPPDEIWHTAEQVWMNMGSAEIARGFILAYRIAAKVIECGGENTFLRKTEFHSGVRGDFYDVPYGVAKKTRVVE